MSDKIHVIVAGNIAAGKTFLIKHTDWIKDPDVYVMKEFIDYDPTLESKLKDKLEGRMNVVDFELSVVLKAYIDQFETEEYKRANIIVWDQAPETIYSVFIPFYTGSKYTGERSDKIPYVDNSYVEVDIARFKLNKPTMNTLVFLDASINDLQIRINTRGRKCESYSFTDLYKYQLAFKNWHEEIIKKRKYFIVLEGAPGAGKTTFVNHIPLDNKYVIKEFTEYLPNGFEMLNKYLNKELDYIDFQLNVVLKSFIDQVQSPAYKRAKYIIWDRSIYSIIDQFSYIAFKRNNIGQHELDVITEGVLSAVDKYINCYPGYTYIKLSGNNTAKEATKLFKEPITSSYVIYLCQDSDLLVKRIHNRGNPHEIKEYDEKYNEMFDECVTNTIQRFKDKYYMY